MSGASTLLDTFMSNIDTVYGKNSEYKFSDDVIDKLKEISGLLNDIQEKEPEGLNYIKGLILKICGATGEYIDLLAQPYTNKFGYAHNMQSGLHGINHTMDKIIAELKSIGATTADGKTDKRARRLKFLETCKLARFFSDSDPSNGAIEELFTIMCNYLNGGGEDEDPTIGFTGYSQYNSFIVLTASGGNLVTIFARLLEYLLNKVADILQDNNTHFETILDAFKIRFANDENILQKLFDKIKNTIKDGSKLEELITSIANDPLSDIDLKLAPYWRRNRAISRQGTSSEVIQFLLARLKIAKICKEIKLKQKVTQQAQLTSDKLLEHKITYDNLYKLSCLHIPGFISEEEIQDLYPSRMKEQYLIDINRHIASEMSKVSPDQVLLTHMKKCKIFLLSLSIIKSANDKATGENIDTISTIENLKNFILSQEANTQFVIATDEMIVAQKELEKELIPLTKAQSSRQYEGSKTKVGVSIKKVSTSATDKLLAARTRFIELSTRKAPSSTEQFITKLRQIIHCGNIVIKRELPTTRYSYHRINECFATSDTLMTSLPVTAGGPGLVIKLMSDILKELITNPDVNTRELLSIIGKFTKKTELAPSTMHSVYTPDTSKPDQYESILSQFNDTILDTMTVSQPKGLKGLILQVDEKLLLPTPKDLTIQGYEAYGKKMIEIQTYQKNFYALNKKNKQYIENLVLKKQMNNELADLQRSKAILWNAHRDKDNLAISASARATTYDEKAKIITDAGSTKAIIRNQIAELDKEIATKRSEIKTQQDTITNMETEVTALITLLKNEQTYGTLMDMGNTSDLLQEDSSVEKMDTASIIDPSPTPPPPPPPQSSIEMSISGGKKKTYKKKIKTKNYKKSRKANKSRKARKANKSRKSRKSRKARKARKYKV